MTNTKTERRLAITPGDWTADNYSVLDSEGHEVVSTDNRELTILIADAGTTYNACHLTPSEMLAELTKLRAERDELVGALREQSKWLTWVPMHHMDDADQSEFASDSKCVDELIAKHKPE